MDHAALIEGLSRQQREKEGRLVAMLSVAYERLDIHRRMLRDKVRVDAFTTALRKAVTPDSVVVDIGAGTGILSIVAAKAGAKRVYAVERTGIGELAQELAKLNGVEDTVTVIAADAQDAEIPEPADIIVSEWLGDIAIEENILGAVVHCRDKWLKPGGIMIPASAQVYLCGTWDYALDEEIDFFRGLPYGLDMTPIAALASHEMYFGRHHLGHERVLTEPVQLWDIDTTSISVEEASGTFRASGELRATRETRINSFMMWFTSNLHDGVALGCAPDTPPTHWGRVVCPLQDASRVGPNNPISFTVEVEPAGIGACEIRWTYRGKDGEGEGDTRRSVSDPFSH